MNHSSDIIGELNDWLGRMGAEASLKKRGGETPDVDIELLRRAIVEIKALREKLGLRRTTQSIGAEDLNASNDE